MAVADPQGRGILRHVREPAFWVTVVAYVALTVGVWDFASSPLFRRLVEQNQNGFLSNYFSKYAGYDVVGAVVTDVRRDLFLFQQAVAGGMAVVLLLFRKLEAVALGILAVILTFVVVAMCVAFLFLIFARHGY